MVSPENIWQGSSGGVRAGAEEESCNQALEPDIALLALNPTFTTPSWRTRDHTDNVEVQATRCHCGILCVQKRRAQWAKFDILYLQSQGFINSFDEDNDDGEKKRGNDKINFASCKYERQTIGRISFIIIGDIVLLANQSHSHHRQRQPSSKWCRHPGSIPWSTRTATP